jgi:uncharacterized protein
MYNLGDRTWLQQPRVMSESVVQSAATRLAEHARAHGITRFTVIFHGGEPLLAGAPYLVKLAGMIRAATAGTGAEVRFGTQTNGTLLDHPTLRALCDGRIGVGVSYDGRRATAEHRPYRSGRESGSTVVGGIRRLSSYRGIAGGLLAVISLSDGPAELYGELKSLGLPSLDFLLPLADHRRRPAGEPGAYGRWLCELFDAWYLDRGGPRIRLLEVLIERLIGRDRRVFFIGPPPEYLSAVIQADGAVELLDGIRSNASGAAVTGLSIFTSSLDEIAAHPGLQQPEPAQVCRECPLFDPCGGGYWLHRWDGTDYDRESVYCEDMKVLIPHIHEKLLQLTG